MDSASSNSLVLRAVISDHCSVGSRLIGVKYDAWPGSCWSWEHACLRSRYLAVNVVQFLILRSLPSNGSTFHNIFMLQLTTFSDAQIM
jgi:hypothetical protein